MCTRPHFISFFVKTCIAAQTFSISLSRALIFKMMNNPPNKLNVLILCTGNSARSIIAEGLFNHLGGNRLKAYSAGSNPTGEPNPYALKVLQNNGIETIFAKSKSWNYFANHKSIEMDLVITVCANAAGEVCPVWPGKPSGAHWGVADPAALEGSDFEKLRCFQICFEQMKDRITTFLAGIEAGEEAKELASKIEQMFPDRQF